MVEECLVRPDGGDVEGVVAGEAGVQGAGQGGGRGGVGDDGGAVGQVARQVGDAGGEVGGGGLFRGEDLIDLPGVLGGGQLQRDVSGVGGPGDGVELLGGRGKPGGGQFGGVETGLAEFVQDLVGQGQGDGGPALAQTVDGQIGVRRPQPVVPGGAGRFARALGVERGAVVQDEWGVAAGGVDLQLAGVAVRAQELAAGQGQGVQVRDVAALVGDAGAVLAVLVAEPDAEAGAVRGLEDMGRTVFQGGRQVGVGLEDPGAEVIEGTGRGLGGVDESQGVQGGEEGRGRRHGDRRGGGTVDGQVDAEVGQVGEDPWAWCGERAVAGDPQVEVVGALALPREMEQTGRGGEGGRLGADLREGDLGRDPVDTEVAGGAGVQPDAGDVQVLVPRAAPAEVEQIVVGGEGRTAGARLGEDVLAVERPAVVVGEREVEVLVAGAAPAEEEPSRAGSERGGTVAGVAEDGLLLDALDVVRARGAADQYDPGHVQLLFALARPGEVDTAVVGGQRGRHVGVVAEGRGGRERAPVVGGDGEVELVVPGALPSQVEQAVLGRDGRRDLGREPVGDDALEPLDAVHAHQRGGLRRSDADVLVARALPRHVEAALVLAHRRCVRAGLLLYGLLLRGTQVRARHDAAVHAEVDRGHPLGERVLVGVVPVHGVRIELEIRPGFEPDQVGVGDIGAGRDERGGLRPGGLFPAVDPDVELVVAVAAVEEVASGRQQEGRRVVVDLQAAVGVVG